MVNLSRTHKATVAVEGETIHVRLARLTFEQAEAHRRTMETIRLRTNRQRTELAAAETLPAAQLDALLDLHAREDQETEAAVRQAIAAYVTVDANQISVDGQMVTTGEDLLNICGDPLVYLQLMGEIEARSRVGAALGKASGSPFDSRRSSGALDVSGPEADGPKPEGTAFDVAPADGIATGDVMGAMAAPSSGSTAPSN